MAESVRRGRCESVVVVVMVGEEDEWVACKAQGGQHPATVALQPSLLPLHAPTLPTVPQRGHPPSPHPVLAHLHGAEHQHMPRRKLAHHAARPRARPLCRHLLSTQHLWGR